MPSAVNVMLNALNQVFVAAILDARLCTNPLPVRGVRGGAKQQTLRAGVFFLPFPLPLGPFFQLNAYSLGKYFLAPILKVSLFRNPRWRPNTKMYIRASKIRLHYRLLLFLFMALIYILLRVHFNFLKCILFIILDFALFLVFWEVFWYFYNNNNNTFIRLVHTYYYILVI